VENSPKPPRKRNEPTKSGRKPPGQFVSNELEEHTARFLQEIKGLAARREEAKSEETTGPPPKRQPPDQRSKRR
jgi:hypothetical protein